jgi:uncharacterized protein (DUF1684 family)
MMKNISGRLRAMSRLQALFMTVIMAASYLVAQERPQSHLSVVPPDSTAHSYIEGIDAWHQRRVDALKKPHGWLSLIALDWLVDGSNAIDSIGTVLLRNGKPFVEIDKGIHATLNGKEFISGMLKTDADDGGPEKVETGPRAFIIIKRGDRYAVRMWDADSPARKGFINVDRFPVSLKWRIDACWRKYKKPRKVKVPSIISGYSEESTVTGQAIFAVDGKECKLEPIVENPDSEYFFIFADKTNGKSTYHSGRFLYADPPRGGKIILDFNKATDPPCAFTPYATCPLPPPNNRLDVRIEAGEKNYGGH